MSKGICSLHTAMSSASLCKGVPPPPSSEHSEQTSAGADASAAGALGAERFLRCFGGALPIFNTASCSCELMLSCCFNASGIDRLACFRRQCASMPFGLLGSLPTYFQKKDGIGFAGHWYGVPTTCHASLASVRPCACPRLGVWDVAVGVGRRERVTTRCRQPLWVHVSHHTCMSRKRLENAETAKKSLRRKLASKLVSVSEDTDGPCREHSLTL